MGELNTNYAKLTGLNTLDVEDLTYTVSSKSHAEKVAAIEKLMYNIPGGVKATNDNYSYVKDSINAAIFGSYSLLGDVTENNHVTQTDVELVNSYVGSTVSPDSRLDLNKDGKVDEKDVFLTKTLSSAKVEVAPTQTPIPVPDKFHITFTSNKWPSIINNNNFVGRVQNVNFNETTGKGNMVTTDSNGFTKINAAAICFSNIEADDYFTITFPDSITEVDTFMFINGTGEVPNNFEVITSKGIFERKDSNHSLDIILGNGTPISLVLRAS